MCLNHNMFIKGVIAGAVVGAAISLASSPQNMKMMKKKTNKLVRTLEDAVDNMS